MYSLKTFTMITQWWASCSPCFLLSAVNMFVNRDNYNENDLFVNKNYFLCYWSKTTFSCDLLSFNQLYIRAVAVCSSPWQKLTMVAEPPLLLIGRYVARVGGRLTGAVEVAGGSRPLKQVTAGQRPTALKLEETQSRGLWVGDWISYSQDGQGFDGARLAVPPQFQSSY